MSRQIVFNPFSAKFDVIDVSEGSSSNQTPHFVISGETYTVELYKQVLFSIAIELEDQTSNLDIEGVLVEAR